MNNIFSPMKIKEVTFKNRIVLPPMCMYESDNEGFVKDFHVEHYVTRAMGGVGTIIVEATAVNKQGVISNRDLGIWDDKHIEGLKRIVESCKKYNVTMGIQLGHAGRKSSYEGEIVAPSAIKFSDEYKVPKELSKEEIKDVVEDFKTATKRALEAGFDFVEIHGAHGYLVSEFLSPLCNEREDEYGGSLEKRVKILEEIINAIKSIYPENLPLFLRVSAKDYMDGGNTPEDLSKIINLVKDLGIDVVDVSTGGVVNKKVDAYKGYQTECAEIIRKSTGLKVITGGLITSVDLANEIIMNDRAEMVFIGRLLLRDPYAPLRWAKELGALDVIPQCYELGF